MVRGADGRVRLATMPLFRPFRVLGQSDLMQSDWLRFQHTWLIIRGPVAEGG